MQWSRDSKVLYLVKDEFYETKGAQLFSDKAELWGYDVDANRLWMVVKPFPAGSYFLADKSLVNVVWQGKTIQLPNDYLGHYSVHGLLNTMRAEDLHVTSTSDGQTLTAVIHAGTSTAIGYRKPMCTSESLLLAMRSIFR